MIGISPFAKRISQQTRKVADKKDILIIGEPGTGKRKLAHEIHQERTKGGQFILLDGRSITHSEIQAVLLAEVSQEEC